MSEATGRRVLVVLAASEADADALGARLGYPPEDVVAYRGLETLADLDPHRTRVEAVPGFPVFEHYDPDEINRLASWQCCGAEKH